jgi:hypothetical protein
MPAALPHTAYGHPALGAVIYLVIVAALVGSAVARALFGRFRRRRPPRR